MVKIVLGLIETIKIKGKDVLARIDTGAEFSSIDKKLASELDIGPVIKTISIRSASGKTIRPVVKSEIKIKGKIIKTNLNIANRSHMKYKMLIGQNILKKGFLIDPSK